MLLRDARRGSKTKEKREGATASKVREEAASRAGAGGGGGERGLAPSVTSTGGRAYVGLPLKSNWSYCTFQLYALSTCKLIVILNEKK